MSFSLTSRCSLHVPALRAGRCRHSCMLARNPLRAGKRRVDLNSFSYGGRDPTLEEGERRQTVPRWNDHLQKARLAASMSLAKDFAATNGFAFMLTTYCEHMGMIDDQIANKFMLLTFNVGICMMLWRISSLDVFDPACTRVSGAAYLRWALDASAAEAVDGELHKLRIDLLKKEATILYLQRFLIDDPPRA